MLLPLNPQLPTTENVINITVLALSAFHFVNFTRINVLQDLAAQKHLSHFLFNELFLLVAAVEGEGGRPPQQSLLLK
jgi:hypothetical protein